MKLYIHAVLFFLAFAGIVAELLAGFDALIK